ncbi:MAG: SDR family NAD(P)-dependent oxidoreductase [Spirochaetota bacterium]
MIDITGRWALVTGASRGIGLRVARALAEKKCRMILHARTMEGTQALLAELSTQGIEAHSVAAELDSEKGIETLITVVRSITGGGLDILYNNAAVMTTYREVFTPTVDEYMTSFMVNTVAPAKLCDAFIPGMLERNFGRIVNVTSGIADQPQLMAYSCSKAALDRYVRDMIPTLEGTNVLMNLMDPGWCRTDLGGPHADHDPDTVIPGAVIPVLLEETEGSGKLYCAQHYAE